MRVCARDRYRRACVKNDVIDFKMADSIIYNEKVSDYLDEDNVNNDDKSTLCGYNCTS